MLLAVVIASCVLAQPELDFPGNAQVVLSLDTGTSPVPAGTPIHWQLDVFVAGNNNGLAGFLTDVGQSLGPGPVLLSPGSVPNAMSGFAAPFGYSNPAPTGSSLPSSYGGSPRVEASGAVTLLEVGGMQNIFGVAGPRMGADTIVETNIATTSSGQTVATGMFVAPSQDGQYCLSLDRTKVYLLFWHGSNAGRAYTMLPAVITNSAGACFEVGGLQCDPLDFNQDTLFPDTQDITDFLLVFAGGLCEGQSAPPPCNTDIDFNNDGLFPDTQDITSLLSVFAGGPCL